MVGPAAVRRRFLILACAWTVFAVYGSLVPLHYQPIAFSDAVTRLRTLPPLWVGIGTRADWVANILLFIPLTFFWMGVVAAGRGLVARVLGSVALIPLACAAAVAIEFAQIWFPNRTVSVNDIFAESIGGCIGIAAWWIAGSRLVSWLNEQAKTRRPRSVLRRALEAYLVTFVFFELLPFDLTISLTDLAHKVSSGGVVLVPFSYRYSDLMTMASQFLGDTATFVPIGALVVVVRPFGLAMSSSFLEGVVGAGVFAAVLEFAQFFVLSRFTDTTDIVLGALGGGVGAWLMHRLDRRSAVATLSDPERSTAASVLPMLGLLAAYSLFLILGFWYPFNWTHSRAMIRVRADAFLRVPFAILYAGTEFNALTQVAIRILLFAPVGALVARVSTMGRAAWVRQALAATGLLYGTALAAGIEIGQILLPPKIADATEIPICVAGVILGFVVMRRILGASGANEFIAGSDV
jgi:glycopeptide antibiotics resistance protein